MKVPGATPNGVSQLVCLSHLRWNFVFQRPQHLMSRAAKTHEVIFFEEPLFEAGSPTLRKHLDPSGVVIATPILPLHASTEEQIALQRTFFDTVISGRNQDHTALWYYTPMALPFTRHVRNAVCSYDNMDELSAFKGASPQLLALEDELFDRADVVFTGGQSLFRAKKHRHGNIHPFPSSIDTAHFARARVLRTEPADQNILRRPRLGFFGVIDERLDLSLLAQLADLRPDWQIIMIGPVVKIDPSTLPQRPNISWLGMKSYQELPNYLAGWDVGIMPFALNEATRFISPTKTPEFLAAGIRVVSTPIADVVDPYGKAGLVQIAETAGEFALACENAFQTPRRTWLSAVDRNLASGSWDLTWQRMERLLLRERTLPNVERQKSIPLHV